MKKKSRIVYCTYNGDLGGGELRMFDHLSSTQFPKSELSVVVMGDGPFGERIRQLGIAVKYIRWQLGGPRVRLCWRTALSALKLLLHIIRQRAGVVFCNTYNDLLLAGPVAFVLGIPVIWRSRGELFPYLNRKRKWKRRLLIWFLNHGVTRILTIASYDFDLAIVAGVQRSRLILLRQGVALERYQVDGNRSRTRSELGINSRVPVVTVLARLVPQKGHWHFLEALERLKAQVPEVHALVVGDVDFDESHLLQFKQSLIDHANKLGLGDSVYFLGWRDDIPALLAASDVLVLPSLKDPLPTVLLEGMAARLPVIASRLPGPGEYVVDGCTGLLVEPGKVEPMADAMARVLLNRSWAKTLGENGYARVQKEFNLVRTVNELDRQILLCLSATSAASYS